LRFLASVSIAVGCLFAVPNVALAVTYTVDSTLDEADAAPGAGGCLTAGAKCTLRAAIEESNASTSVKDTIDFAAAFNGQLADTIAITLGGFPSIADEVTIDGDKGTPCTTAALLAGPCVGVSGSAGLDVNSDDVEIKGLAVVEAGTGVNVINGSSGFTATNNWIGVKLDGSPGANTTGIFIDPDSNGASIGGMLPADRNVIANNSNEGLDIEGADDAVVRGNYFGVKPDGITAAANGKNIEVTDSTAGGGFEATDNEIGRMIEGEAEGTAACDGGCNVIAGGGLSTGIDLDGESGGNEAPATGPTTVHGNYVGLGADGTTVAANGTFNILAGAAEDATIGGPTNGDANFIAGGTYAIYHENGEGFEATGNVIGSGPAGDVTPPAMAAFIFAMNNANPVSFSGNVVRMEGNIAIESRFGGAVIEDNFIEGANTAIRTLADPGAAGGDLIEDNVIGESGGTAIVIENDSNEVLDNAIYGSTDGGIRINNAGPLLITTGNVIGGDTPAEENTIRENGGDAIEIVDESGNTEEDSFNEVARNHGEENAGLFIDLVGNANAGILPPQIDSAKLDGASGSGAGAGANVRVFRKETAEAGEIESFLGEAIADSSGDWSVNYISALPGETRIAATQTSIEGATSELAFAQTEPEPKAGNGGGNGGGGGGSEKPVPQTTIKKGPKGKTHSTTAKFRFISSLSGSTFECKLDRKKFKPCKSPKTYKKLKPGKHVFRVRAKKGGVTDPTPAVRKFKVLA
jgi:CSLREA domain-containing protein